MFWAWERPEDLRFLEHQPVGIAYLAATLRLSGNDLSIVARRHQPLRTTPSTPLLPVFRIETDPRKPLANSARQQAVKAILDNFAVARLNALQIDFDTRRSERMFYRALLTDLRARLGPDVFISITALASWCDKGSWIESLPVNEAVPMLFRMGPEREPVLTRLMTGGDFGSRVCRTSAGIATDEVAPPIDRTRRLYVFPTGPWNPATVARYIQ